MRAASLQSPTLPSERWGEVSAAFAHAAELPRLEQELWLGELAARDGALERELRSLLAADGEQGLSLLRLAEELAPVEPAEELRPGDQLGLYQLLRRLGEGGMSTVYLAVRCEGGLQKRVAIKVLRRELASAEMCRRFERERRILASLDHPAIARWLDGGSTPSGSPYLVMEAVEGSPIDEFCRVRGLSPREIAALFVEVAAGVQHAHQNLIVHRDLKPGNLLVTASGAPKLLDFGIAKLLNPELAGEATLVTAPRVQPMTLAYASPEQLRGESLTTASDIYSLGVLLFEVLAGERPFAPEGKSDEETRHQVRPGSTRGLRETAKKNGRAAPNRDLEAIVAKALRQEPWRRYGSASELAADLRRWLEFQPVEARRGRWTYRLGKALRRNPLAAILGVGVLLFAAGMAWQAGELEEALGEARREQRRAEKVSSFLVGMFEVADPSVARGREPTARELLGQGRQRLNLVLRDEPELAARLLETWGLAQQNLGLYEEAGHDFELALERLREVGGPASAVSEVLSRLAFLRLSQGNFRQARRLNDEALHLRLGAFGHNSLEVADSLHNLAEVTQFEGQFNTAEPLYRQALELRLRLAPDDASLLADSYGDLGYLLYDLERFDEAETLLRRAVELWERAGLGGGREHAACLNSLATVVQERGDLAAAEELYLQALSMRRRIFPAVHPDLARSYLDLGYLQHVQGRLEAAEQQLVAAVALYRQLGPDHRPMLGSAISYLANLRRDQGRFAEARELARETVEIYETSIAADHPFLSLAREQLAALKALAPPPPPRARSRSNGQSTSKE